MSYGGWSVGDIIQGIRLAWSIYEAVGVGMRSAKGEFAAFRVEFNLIKCALERLQEVAANCPGEDLDLGKGYELTLSRCADFIKKHESLSKEAESLPIEETRRRPSFGERMVGLWDKVSWPMEREEAEKLRVSLDRYVQIAILKVTSNTRDVTRQLARDSEQARVDHLEILKAVKTMSVQVSSILKRCLPDGAPNDPTPDAKYLARLQRRHLSSLLDPLPGLNAIPEDDVLSQSDSQAALQRIQDITDRLGHLALRLDTIGRQMTPSPERIQPVKRTNTNESIGSDTTIVAPVVDLLNQIGDEVREALDKVGYEHVVIPSQQRGLHGTGKPTKVLNNAVDDWDQFKDWLQFQLVHSLEMPSRLDMHPASPELHPLPKTPYGSSPPASSYLTPSPRWIPQDHLTTLSRPPSIDLSYPQSPSSVDSSSWDRRSSLQSLPLTHHPVTVLFPDSQNSKSSLHRPVTCQLAVYLHPRTNEPDLIEGTDPETGIKLTHSLKRERPSRNTETSMTPYIRHSWHSSPLSITFMGSHRLKLEQESKVHRWHISPVYICHDKQDFDMFQSTLLRRSVLFCGDVSCIQTSNMLEHCSQETVRVLQDPITGSISILYFASNRGPQTTLKGFLDLPVTDFSLPQKAGKANLKLPLQRAQKDGFGGPLLRRNSVESSVTTLSQESRTSRGSAASSCSDTPWKKEKWVQFCFEADRGMFAIIVSILIFMVRGLADGAIKGLRHFSGRCRLSLEGLFFLLFVL